MADDRIIDLQPLNERQESLIKQVKAGKLTEAQPDTTDQLLTLARLGHLDAEPGPDGFSFSVPKAKRGNGKK